MPLILGAEAEEISGFLDTCRTKRHDATYEGVQFLSSGEAEELQQGVRELHAMVTDWFRRQHA